MPPETTTVETQPSTPAPVTPSVSTPEPATASTPSYSERVEQVLRAGGENAKKYRLTGEIPEWKPETNSEVTAASSTATEPDSTVTAPVTTDNKPPQKKKEIDQDRNWSETRRLLSEKDGQIDLLRRQLADKGSSAPPATKEVEKPSDPRPKFPNIADFDDEKKYQTKVDEWFDQDTQWQQRQIDRRFSTEKQSAHTEKVSTQWNDRLNAAKTKYSDFETVAFSENTPASGAMIHLIQTLDNGTDVAYWLGKNPEAASRIAELTDIPGLDALRKSNPVEAAMKWGEALGLARAEFSRIQIAPVKSPKTPAAPQKPLKEVIAAAPRPSLEVEAEGGAAPIADPIQAALKSGNVREYMRLQNQKDMAERKGRR